MIPARFPAAFLRTASLLALVLLPACAASGTAEEFDRRMATYVGRPEGDVVAGLGVPARTYEAEGRRLLAYEFNAPATSPAIYPGIGLGLGFGGFGSSVGLGTGLGLGLGGLGGSPATTCTVTFELRDGRVTGYDRRGDGCTAVAAI